MPELGETWSVMECDGDVGRLEAVVIATGPTMVRLVTRSGRRITFPSGRWDVAWSFVHPPPAEPRPCTHCRQAAFFRHTVGGDIAWVCEDHVPHGARAYFPGDAPGPPTVGLSCPRCEATKVEVDAQLIELAGTRTTARCTCERCRCRWATLVGRGLGDDGTVLAGDLTRLIQEDPSVSEVWLGFVAYRNLCRAVGMGDVAHLHGVTLHSKSSLADALTVVFFGTDSDLVRTTTAGERPPAFGAQFPALEIRPGSLWKRRRSDWGRDVACRVESDDNERHVTFRVLALHPEDRRPSVTLPVDDFMLYWTPNVPLTECPRAWTIWQHIETGQVVQVTPGTPIHVANHQVSYFTADGRRETTPVVTFYRLHHELPTPPESHIWYRDGALFTAQLSAAGVVTHPYAVHEESRQREPRVVTFGEFYSQYVPLVFEDELIVYDQEVVVQRGTPWVSKHDSGATVSIIDIGRARNASDYVRFADAAAELHVEELLKFLSKYDWAPREMPCVVGETWVDLENPKREVSITRVDPAFGKVVVRWDSEVSTTLNVEELVAQFRKLDVRSYWEILDSTEEP